MEPDGNYPERVITPDGPGRIVDYHGELSTTGHWLNVELDDGGWWKGHPHKCDPETNEE